MPSVFDKHVFICINQRENDPNSSCANKNGLAVFEAFKAKVTALNSQHKIRINRAGCLGHCKQGLVMVIYPEGQWYQQVKIEDVDEIIEKSILNDLPVTRLSINV